MIDQIFSAIGRTVNRHPKLIIAAIGVLFVIALYGMTMITMDTSNNVYIDKTSPEGITNNHYTETINKDIFVLIIKTSDPTSPAVLNYMDRLEGDIRQQRYISGVSSIVDILKQENHGVLPQNKGEIDALISQLPPSAREIYLPSNVLVLMEVEPDSGISAKLTQTTVLDTVQQVVEQSNPPPGLGISISGMPAFHAQLEATMGSQMGVLIGAAMILMVIMMGLLFSYVSHRFLPVLFVGLGLTTAMGIMGLAGIQLTLAVLGAFPVMIGLGIDYAIQFHARLDEEARKGSLEDAVYMTITRTGPAVMYAMLATSLGFAAMFVSTVPMIRSFGLVAMIGIMSCYAISLVGLPALALVIHYKPKAQVPAVCYGVGEDACEYLPPAKSKKKSWSYSQFLTDSAVKIAKNPVPILLIGLVIAVIGFQIDPLIPINADQKDFVPSTLPAKIDLDTVTNILGSTVTADYYIQGARVTDLDTIQWMKTFQDYELSHQSHITSATSIVTYIIAYNGGTMPQTQSQVDAALEKIPQGIKDQFLSGSTRGLIVFTTTNLQIPQQQDLKNQLQNDITFLDPPPGITLSPVGDFEVFTTVISSLVASKDEMTYLGFAFIFVYLLLVYRHIHAVSPLIPIIFIVGWNSVVMYVLGIAYTPMTATLASMTIGVAAEYTILVMERYSEEEERLHDPVAAIQESVSRIGSAITVSGLATFFGFSALCLSSFPIISNFGICTLIAVGFSLFGAIFVMPAVLSLMGKFSEWLEKRKHQQQTAPEMLAVTKSPD
ncbi:hydrophobe/amphiphile efflux-3 (HAE3) family transporter [Methanoregula sp.]|uniref:efflux RND transporter permease subunit n=1 Tax=Methanoregula sp. TaxID=2052170 RepID=UPI002B9D06B3|nr:hydrophobe/amphiphile efflux-3 (HAE3) family transporter [Methanoregula sp.]HVP96912.1 hydrophobe/amphiphile efflux-3 (HAE3) family transporter [Methanoregula sp.]